TLLLNGSTINGPGVITNATGLSLASSTINAPFLSQADILVAGLSTIANPTGTFGNVQGATLTIQGSSSYGGARLTVANGFANGGTIELTDVGAAYGANLTVTNGSLTNAAGAEIRASAGAGGNRALNLELLNDGAVQIAQTTTLGRSGADHVNN